MVYGYARVSTKNQLKGAGLEIQENHFKKLGCEIIYKECYTGMTADRPVFKKLLKELKKGDKLVFAYPDRFIRTPDEGIEIIKELTQRGVVVHIEKIGDISINTEEELIRLRVMLAMMEFSRDVLCENMQDGRIEKGKNGGRPKKVVDKANWDRVMVEYPTVTERAKALGISRGTYYKILKKIA